MSEGQKPRSNSVPKIQDMTLLPMNFLHMSQLMPAAVAGIMDSLPPGTKNTETVRLNVQGALLDGRLQAWAIVEYPPGDTGVKMLGVGTTIVRPDEFQGNRELVIYSLSNYPNAVDDAWRRPFEVLRDYARTQGCWRIVAYSQVNGLARIVRRLGGDIKWRILSLEV